MFKKIKLDISTFTTESTLFNGGFGKKNEKKIIQAVKNSQS
jgi:hypothetical protein